MPKPIRAVDVFTPGSFPTHTYVERGGRDLEADLRRALDTPGQIVSLAGPSKSGKTVLVEHVVTNDNLIPLSGSRIRAAEDLWDHALDWMGEPHEQASDEGTSHKGSLTVETKGGASLVGVAKAEVGVGGSLESGGDRNASKTHRRRGMPQVVEEVSGSTFVLLIDDFHYIPPEVQSQVAQQLKEAARQGVKFVVASVPHRSDDVIRANADLRGRVQSLDLSYWSDTDLARIADLGFGALNIAIDRTAVEIFSAEAAGSPQLMQFICLNTCHELNVDARRSSLHRFTLEAGARRRILERTASATDYRSLVTILDSGPKTRGIERKTYRFSDQEEGDVYTCILRAVAADPPRLSFDYDEINRRVARVCVSEKPAGSSVVSSCKQMSVLATQRILDWDEEKQILDIADPYLLFYLRWSGYQAL